MARFHFKALASAISQYQPLFSIESQNSAFQTWRTTYASPKTPEHGCCGVDLLLNRQQPLLIGCCL
jgi:hypothetical protein